MPYTNEPQGDSGDTRKFIKSENPQTPDRDDNQRTSTMHGCLASIIYIAIIVGVSMLLSALAIMSANEIFAFVKPDKEIAISIPASTKPGDVYNTLQKNGVIGNAFLFDIYMSATGAKDEITPGEYTLNSNMDYHAISKAIGKHAAVRETIDVTVPEGMTQYDVFSLLEKKGVCSQAGLMDAAAQYDFRYSWVKQLPKGNKRLEGYLFPDTYTFYIGDKPENVINKFLANFNKKYDVDMKTRAAELELTLQEVITIASMIEGEAKLDEERPLIASVIYNRLANDNFPNLQIDATIQYALPSHKKVLTSDDLAVDSPYNTYTHEGLPPGAICNPGIATITAALYPEDTGYYYYVAAKDGSHIFSKTHAEHEAAIKRVRENQ